MRLANEIQDFDYYILIKGHDLPLRSKSEMKRELINHRGIILILTSCNVEGAESSTIYKCINGEMK
jgi:hypothetical protein